MSAVFGNLKRILSLLISLIWCVITTLADVTGTVIDDNQTPVEFVNVILMDSRDSLYINGTTTDSAGRFSIINPDGRGDMLRLSCIGYQEIYRKLNNHDENAGVITMTPKGHQLGSVTVTADRPMFYQDKGSLVTNVQGTVLGDLYSTDDVLAQIPGMVLTPTGALEVFGLGNPIIYINNRRISSNAELQQLTPKDIKSIQLITNPGASYDASGRAVLKITTIRRGDGLLMEIGGDFRQNERSSFGGNVNIGYRHNGVNFSANYGYDSYAMQARQPSGKELHLDSHTYTFIQDTDGDGREKEHTWALKTDYEINDRHVIGISWDASASKRDDHRLSEMDYQLDSEAAQQSHVINDDSNKTHYNHVNVFHNAQWHKQLTSRLNLDYVSNTNRYNQISDETNEGVHRLSPFSGKSSLDIYGAKFAMDYQISDALSMSAGADYSHVGNDGNMFSDTAVIPSSDYTNSEDRYAAYAELNSTLNQISIGAGIRYEYMKMDYNDHLDSEANVRRRFSNVYPSLSLSHNCKGWGNTLSFSSRTRRPSFSQLSAMSYYQNRYMYQHGNPLLVPSTSYILQWDSGYKFVNFSLGYTYTKDFITNDMYTIDYDGTTQIISSYANRDKVQYIKANVTIQKNIAWWRPTLSAGVNKQFFQTDYLGETINCNRPQYYLTFNQYFTLPKSTTISAYYYFNSGGDQGSLRFKPYQMLNIGIQKSFLNKRLTVRLKANDIFHTMKFKVSEYRGNIHFWQTEDYRMWNYSVSITYRLNKKKKIKYRGDESISDEIERID